MVEPALALLAGALAYVIGTVPLGAAWVHRLTGHEARDLNPHLLGVENVFRLAGAPAALGSFFLDVLKGMVAVAGLGGLASAAAPWAAACV